MKQPSKTRAGIAACAATIILAAATPAGASTQVGCHVPRLNGYTLAQARLSLTLAHCRLGRTTGPKSGQVLSQNPRPGQRRARGATVAVTLARLRMPPPTATSVALGVTSEGGGNTKRVRIYPTVWPSAILMLPLTYTITDATTGQTLATFTEPARDECVIDQTVGNGTVTYSNPFGGFGCQISPITGRYTDHYMVTAAFAGNPKYAPSVSRPASL